MKYAFLLSFVLFFGCKEAAPGNPIVEYGTIEIFPRYCKYDNDVRKLNSNFKLFKKGKLIKEIKDYFDGDNETFKSETGNYILEYKTIFNYKRTIKFELKEGEIKSIFLCFDFLDYELDKNILLIDELKNGETLKIYFQSMRCFGGSEKELAVIKKEGKLEVAYESNKYPLNESQLRLIREFEVELKSNHSSGCSTIDTYKLENIDSKQSQLFKDSSCQWNGFENLLELLSLSR